MKLVKVKMAEFEVTKAPNTLITYGLGSCVGVVLYDPVSKIGGMAHVMLPSPPENKDYQISKYADSALPAMLKKMIELGAKKERIIAHLAGGANMFAFIKKAKTMQIGEKNTEACIRLLNGIEIPILTNNTGGENGRTIKFNCETGEFSIDVIKRNT